MNRMDVTPWLMVSHKGPITCASEGEEQVHMRQGDADGACGPYALMMALLTLGVVTRNEIMSMGEFHGNSRIAKFRNALVEHGALICGGTNTLDLIGLADHFTGVGVKAERVPGSKIDLVKRVRADIKAKAIPLISVSWSRLEGHWMMVVGHQGYEEDGVYHPTHLLCLDPLSEAPKASLWNAVIQFGEPGNTALRSGTFTCDYWDFGGNVSPCKLDEVLTVSIG